MKHLILAVACSLSLLAPVPAMADWAVAQAAPGGKPFVQRFRSISWARDITLEACRKQYQNCKVIASGAGGCLAIATTGSKWGVGKAGSKQRAHAAALKACDALGAGPCRVEDDFCGQ
ncbi:DUF4189 domain-containing protein [Devosia sp. Root413D1]|uniref:DUF4189 domain-containing protein n=1 Tax=Devosia sp. Root413D1 TaxID=1736531 RepID=UPI000AF7F239|nr:DUF4189 domain-containing protein [Devosia sp. Root413D1]